MDQLALDEFRMNVGCVLTQSFDRNQHLPLAIVKHAEVGPFSHSI